MSYEKHSKSRSGLPLTTTVYECSECAGCPMKEKCIKACGSKKALEERHKVIYVSKRFARQRKEMEAKISSPKGILLRVNRSIQAEGTFAFVKEDMNFRRFLLRGSVKVNAEWLLYSLALNIPVSYTHLTKPSIRLRVKTIKKPENPCKYGVFELVTHRGFEPRTP